MTQEQWKLITAGEVVEVTEEDFENFLDVLPPAFMHKLVTLQNGRQVKAAYGFVEGADRITAFWTDGTAYFAANTMLFSRGY